MEAGIGEECGVVAVYGVPDAARLAYESLLTLQHRGQESAGIIASDGARVRGHKGLGLLYQAVPLSALAELPGHVAIGHVRYSTTGSGRMENTQPLVVEYAGGVVVVAHNGNLTNSRSLRSELSRRGAVFGTSTDSELFAHVLAAESEESAQGADALGRALARLEGAYAVAFLEVDGIWAARDPRGFRPLSIGRIGDGFIIASETCVFDITGAELVRDVEPGEIIRVDAEGLRSTRVALPAVPASQCIFEHIYFSRPDSRLFGEPVHDVRTRLGAQLHRDHPVDADLVIPVPDSGYSAAQGYAQASGIPQATGFVRNRYVGRTFIMPEGRASGVQLKLNALRPVVAGKRLVVVDDSIVRATTSRSLIAALRNAGAAAVHMRISAPPIISPCYFGIDLPHASELIGARMSVEEIREYIGADSLAFQTVEGLRAAVNAPDRYCFACFTGVYPLHVRDDMHKMAMEDEPPSPTGRDEPC